MELFIMRHGGAVFKAPEDRLRELSARGRQEVSRAIDAKKTDIVGVECLVVSPYLRAQQTADIVCQSISFENRDSNEILVPSGDPKAVVDYLYFRFHQHQQKSIMLISHLPLVGDLIDQLCGCVPGKHKMGTASLAAIGVDVPAIGCCRLRWLHHEH